MKRTRGLATVLAVVALPGVAVAGDETTTRRVTVSPEGKPANDRSYGCDVAAGARAVAFDSFADNLVPGDTNGESDVFVADSSGGIERVSVTSRGHQTETSSGLPAISASGRVVAFTAGTYDLGPRGNRNRRMTVYVHDRRTGRTTRASDRSDGRRAIGHAYDVSISGSGRFVAFVGDAPDLAMKGDRNGVEDVFVHDRRTDRTNRVSLSRRLGDPNQASTAPDLSRDGRYVAFASWATNLLRGDRNGELDVFVYDRAERRTELVSVTTDGEQGTDYSFNPSISADGRYVAFTSYARLTAGDAAGTDVYLHDRVSGVTEHVSVGLGGPGNGDSDYPSISDDGRYVAFLSGANNLVAGDTNGLHDAFVRDRVEGKTIRVSVGDDGEEGDAPVWPAPALSPDGRYACWISAATNLDHIRDEGDEEDVFLRGPLF